MKYLFGLLSLISSEVLQAQSIDYNRIIIPEDVSQVSFEERLIQLAWKNHPSNTILMENVRISKNLVNQTNWNWLNDIYAIGNINEFNIDPSSDVNERSQFYPRYNFGIRISLGTLFLTPMKSKVAQSEVLISKYRIDEKKIALRSELLVRLEQFKEQYKVLRIRSRLVEDLLMMYKEAEKEFANGRISIDQYRSASQAYYIKAEDVINTQSQFFQRKLELEQLIGVLLEEITGYDDYLKTLSKLN